MQEVDDVLLGKAIYESMRTKQAEDSRVVAKQTKEDKELKELEKKVNANEALSPEQKEAEMEKLNTTEEGYKAGREKAAKAASAERIVMIDKGIASQAVLSAIEYVMWQIMSESDPE